MNLPYNNLISYYQFHLLYHLNNIVDLKSLIHELKFQKKGRYNKYEYRYDEENNDLKLICKVKEWE